MAEVFRLGFEGTLSGSPQGMDDDYGLRCEFSSGLKLEEVGPPLPIEGSKYLSAQPTQICIMTSDDSSVFNLPGSFSFSAYLYIEELPDTGQSLVFSLNNFVGASSSGPRLRIINNKLVYVWYDGVSSNDFEIGDLQPPLGEWFKVTFGYNGSSHLIYINNQLSASYSGSYTAQTGSDHVLRAYAYNGGFVGSERYYQYIDIITLNTGEFLAPPITADFASTDPIESASFSMETGTEFEQPVPIEVINHKELALSRLVTQFRESNLRDYLCAMLSEADTLEGVFQDILNGRSIDTAVGKQLDILGQLVGQPRELLDASEVVYFGFQGNPQANSFGTLSDPTVGGRFRSLGENTTGLRSLTDEEYRLFIRARTFKNITTATINETIDQIQTIFDVQDVTIVEGAEAEYTVTIGKVLSTNEKLIITNGNIIPKPAGVTANYADLNGPI